MFRRIGSLSLAAMAVVALPRVASAQDVGRFQAYEDQEEFTPAALPALLSARRVQVMVKMSADPVAVVRARAVGKVLSAQEGEAVAARVHAQHEELEPKISAQGGTVLFHMHHAYNGFQIEIDREKVGGLEKLPGVVEVMPVRIHERTNATTVPFIGAPQVWGAVPGFRGEGIKIAVLDTGVDYTHANFAGPGTVAAYQAAAANAAAPADPALFGPSAPKVKGGYDLVGDAYNASSSDPAKTRPAPDPNPLDCGGHGSHTAGTALGFGVNADGSTYTGPYDSTIYTPKKFKIGPGVAPKADLYAYKVFGCEGSTNVVAAAIDMATAAGVDVISMSLGSSFGTEHSADTEAALNAAKAGIIVVASSGNSGSAPYILGSPSSGSAVISVAATDATPSFPGATLQLTSTVAVTVQNSNGGRFADGTQYPVVVLRNKDGSLSLGCSDSDYDPARNGGVAVAGKLVVTKRGVCARVWRAGLAQKYGAAAAAMINTDPGFPPYEGDIPADPTAFGGLPAVTIPFFGARSGDAKPMAAAEGTTISASNVTLPNPGFAKAASFTSSGPRFGDSSFKPGLTAPGVAVVSTAVGTGTQGAAFSGTSMACPHVAGVAALVKQAHKEWSATDQRAAILQTANPTLLRDYLPRLEGAGLVQPMGAILTQAVIRSDDDNPNGLSFGFAETLRDYRAARELSIENHGESAVQFNVSVTKVTGDPSVQVVPDQTSIWVGPDDDADLTVRLQVPAAGIPATHDANGNDVFADVSGYLTLTPATPSMNNGVALRMPYYLVPRVRSNAFAFTDGTFGPSRPAARLYVTNFLGGMAASPDFYSWGLRNKPQGVPFFDTRAVGVQSIATGPSSRFLVFAINTFARFSNPAAAEFDLPIWTRSPTTSDPDYYVVGADLGALTTGRNNGVLVSAVLNMATGSFRIRYYADAPTDGSTVLLPVRASDLGLSSAAPRFTYGEATFNNIDGSSAQMPGLATFNAWNPSIVATDSPKVAPNGYSVVDVTTDAAEFAQTPALGVMVVDADNRSGKAQAQLLQAE